MSRLATAFQRSIVGVALLVGWQVLGSAGYIPRYVSTPSAVIGALVELSSDGELWTALGVSILRAGAGFALGAASGLLAGLAAGLLPPVRNFFDPIVSFLFSVPKIAFLPVFLLLLGIGNASKIAIIAFSCFFPVFIAARHAILSVDKLIIWSARNMGASQTTLFFRVLVPAAAPQLFTGLRIGLAHAFVVLFAAELIGSHAGLGTLIKEGEDAARFDLMFAGIFCFGAIGFIADRILMAVRKATLRGQTLGTQEMVSR